HIDWIIVGGESGHGARPMKKEWVISLRDQARTQRVAFFFKQWGGVHKSKTGRRLDGRTYDELPLRVQHPVMTAQQCSRAAADIESRYLSQSLPPSLPLLNPAAV
ncbi:MAG TPA: DUF5131 family protein, partial [Candidatus Acidoferrales bacterium]|nr:DUF5131 family protein [Candidatus Acidoferrales bacterium]